MSGDTELSRLGLSLPKNLHDKIDAILRLRGNSSHSEGIRDSIRNYITHYQWISDVKGERQGVITMVYDHDQRGLLQTLTEIQHQYAQIIQASLHSHVTHNKCLEVILIRGDGAVLKDVTERLMAQKGVESVKLTTIPIDS